MLSDFGELLFTIAIGYMGAIELLFVLKHLYHWSCQHHRRLVMLHEQGDEESLKELQAHIQKSIDEAGKEEIPGFKRMKDGIFYKDGFRIDPNKVTEEKINESIKREIIGSSEYNTKNANYENLNRNIKTETEIKKKDFEVTTKLHDREENIKIREDMQLKSNEETGESTSNQNEEEKMELKEDLIIKEETQLISSSFLPSKKVEQNSSMELEQSQLGVSVQEDENERINLTQTVKTQFGQTNIEKYSLRTPSISNVGKSDDSSSNEPWSSQKSSSLSTQQSSSLDTAMSVPEMHFGEYERQAPDGEDVSSEQHYSDEYLRSLDGIKNRPLIRDDGSGRRRAFKKRRSSGDSTSSRESRQSREEELKMFTSLEEEEFATMKKGPDGFGGDYTPIKYSSDSNLKVTKTHRRRKRSPAQDAHLENSGSTSLEMLGEEDTNPWGDVKPEHYKNTEFWKREKSNSIPEELEDTGIAGIEQDSDYATHEDRAGTSPPVENIPKMSSFEEATHSQHEKAISILQIQSSKDYVEPKDDDIKQVNDENSEKTKNVSNDETKTINSHTLADQIAYASAFDEDITSQVSEEFACNQAYDHVESNSTGSGLRRSPRMDEIDHYEERWEQEERRKSSSLTPTEQNLEESATILKQNSLEIRSSSTERSVTPEKLEIKITYEPKIEYKENIMLENQSTPSIEIDYASDDDSENQKVSLKIEDDEDFEEEIPVDIMVGLSDFYDFNASVNPSRSRGTSTRRSKSAEPLSHCSTVSRSKSPFEQKSVQPLSQNSTVSRSKIPVVEKSETSNKFVNRSPSPDAKISEMKQQNISFISDFYDFNVNLNKKAYSKEIDKNIKIDECTHRDNIDLIIEDIDKLKLECKLENLENLVSDNDLTIEIERLKNDLIELRLAPLESHNELSSLTPETPEYPTNITQITTQIPDYSRSFSTEFRDVERLKEEMISGGFKRSQYVGESTDFSDDFEDLREQTRCFQRSQSKSRSPIIAYDDIGLLSSKNAAKKKMQERILDEITKTTVDFQDFSQNLSQDFLEYERRVSDSALIIQKPEILIQFEDELDDLEPDEYHHFRRFSIQQEYQVEEYPEDNIIYVDQIEVLTADGTTETWKSYNTYITEDNSFFSDSEGSIINNNLNSEKKIASTKIAGFILDNDFVDQDFSIHLQDSALDETCNFENKYSSEYILINNSSSKDEKIFNSSVFEEEVENVEKNEIFTTIEEFVKNIECLEEENSIACDYTENEVNINNDKISSEVCLFSMADIRQENENGCSFNELEANNKTIDVVEDLDEENQNADEFHETDSNSSDDRQTIVEVDDGIDVDVWDYNEQTEESYNEQSECEELERTIDNYVNTTVSDWSEEGAVGGIIDQEFEEMYDEAIKDRKQSGIQRDYDGIIENEKIMECDDEVAVRTEDLLEEILKADQQRYGWSLNISRASSRESNRSLLDGSEHRYLADAVSQSITSTRLRSRYGLAPATGSYANFENYDDIDVNYKPRKEYNWRKNFKLDEDNADHKIKDNSKENCTKFKQSLNKNIELYDDTGNLFDLRKYSLGGESIILFSRSSGNSENDDDCDNLPEENKNYNSIDAPFIHEENQEHPEVFTDNVAPENKEYLYETEKTEEIEVQLDDVDKIPKKKKSKKKLRKGSKVSLGNDDENIQSRRESLLDPEIVDSLEETPKKKSKKKKVKDIIVLEEDINIENNIGNKVAKLLQEENKSLNDSASDNNQSMSTNIPNESPIETNYINYSHNPTENTIKSQSVESLTLKSENESISRDSITPKSIDNKSNNSSIQSQKLDKINSSDITELIKDSSILGSSF